MRTTRLPYTPLLAAAALLLAAAPARAVDLAAGSGSGLAGQTVDVAISTTSLTGQGVLAYELALDYNPTVVTATDVLEAGTLPGAAGWGDATFQVTSGRIRVSHAGTTALSGSGSLVVVRFQIAPSLLNGGFTTLALNDAVLNEGTPAVTTSNGSITVGQTPQIDVTPDDGDIARGETLEFSVSGSVTPPVTWGVTQPTVASISGAGVLTGTGPGSTRVFAVDDAGRRDTTDGLVLVRGMRVTVGTAGVVVGQSATVDVDVTSLNGLSVRSGELEIAYNPARVTPTGVATAGTMLAGYGSLSFGASNGVFTVSFAGTSDLTGSGVLCRLQFATVSDGPVPLVLQDAVFNETLPAARTNGSIDVDPLPTITVSPDDVTLLAGETQQFTAAGATAPIQWSTLDPAVATIASSGLLTAVAGGVTRVRAQDAVNAVDENAAVRVYDFRVTVPEIFVSPGGTARVPLLLSRDVSSFAIHSTQFTLIHDASVVTDARPGGGLVTAAWGAPTLNEQSDRIVVAGAGVQALGSGQDSLIWIELDVSGSATVGSSVPLVVTGLLCNEGSPAVLVANGLLRIANPTPITVDTSPAGLSITVDGTSYTAPQSFQWMPGSSHTLAVVSPQGSGGTRRVFANWSDGGAQSHTVVAPAFANTYTASFDTQHLLTTAASPAAGGSIAASPLSGDGWYAAGTFVQLTATANSGFVFSSWSGDATGSSNPTFVSMDGPRSVTANFTALTSVTVTTSPAGLSITVDGTNYTAPQSFQWVPGSSHILSVTSPQGAGNTRRVFASWSDGGAQSHMVTAPSSTTTYTANFTTQHQLTTTASPPGGGTVMVSPASGDGFYNQGTVVQLTANANAGFQFSSWSGDASGSSNPVNVTMSAPRSVTASFVALTSITVTTSPAALSITVDGSTFTAPQSFQWVPGSSHTIATTSPQGAGNTRRVFASWSDGGALSHAVIAPASTTTYTASFTTQHRLTTAVAPSGAGSVAAAPTSGDGFYNQGTVVQLTATANAGFQFSNWSGDATGTSNPVSVTMSAPRSVTANFTTTTGIDWPGWTGDFQLRQNAPNPFATSTRFLFGLPREGWTTLRVYDLAGRRVASLVEAHLPAGVHAREWNGRDRSGRILREGVYVVRLESAGRVHTRRISILR